MIQLKEKGKLTSASLSAAREAYIFGCNATFCMLVACGNECSDDETLGKATRLEGADLFDVSRDMTKTTKIASENSENNWEVVGNKPQAAKDVKK